MQAPCPLSAMSSGGTHAGNATSTVWWAPEGVCCSSSAASRSAGKRVGDTNKCRPDPSVDERDSALDQASCNDIPGREKAVENGEDRMAGWVAPPASVDRLAGDLAVQDSAPAREQTATPPPAHTPKPTDPWSRIQPPGRSLDYELGRGPDRVRAPDELGCLIWPCSQNPGRKPAISRRA